jgi:uracil-DNA glycosylase family 4
MAVHAGTNAVEGEGSIGAGARSGRGTLPASTSATEGVILPSALRGSVQNVTDRASDPFDLRPPCERPCPGGHRAVLGFGDANADVHVIGDHPGIHGGEETGIPFTGTAAGERLQRVLEAVGLLERRGTEPVPADTYLSYCHMCCAGDQGPTEETYRTLERFLDAELRAISAHVLVPVGERPVHHVVDEYTSQRDRVGTDHEALHGREIRGRGFLVLPVKEPGEWAGRDEDRLERALGDLLSSDYRQLSDLGRFEAGGSPYFVR